MASALLKRRLMVGAALVGAGAAAITFTRSRAAARADATSRVRELYDRVAGRYDSMITIPERLLFADGRRWAAAEAMGDVLEIAVGTGRNFAHYTADVRITGQDISREMLKFARARAEALGRAVHLRVGDAQDLEFSDEAFDCVVSTLALCTIPDDRRALAEAWRVLRPGGQLIALEHVRSPGPAVRRMQRFFAPLALRCAGDHLLRDPLDHLASVGFSLEYCARSRAGIVERLIARKKTHDARTASTAGDNNGA